MAELGFATTDVGCSSTDPVDYPVFAARVADAVAGGEALFGIVVDGAGIGSAMVANKISGVRAAACYDVTTAKNAREHNNANVLTLGGGQIGERLASEIARIFLTTRFAGGRHAARVAMIDALDR
jgi:ribose 5-phosphate isomerase B